MPTDIGGGYGSKPRRIKGTDPRVRQVTDRIGRGYLRDVQAEQVRRGGLSAIDEAAAQDDFARRIFAAAQSAEPTGARAKTTGGGFRFGTADNPDDYYYHSSPAANRAGIRRRGLDPTLKKGYSEGVHFSGKPDYPAIEDRHTYRVRRSDVSNPQYRSGGDVYTRSLVPPERLQIALETPEGSPTRWGSATSNAYSRVAGPLSLINMVASLFGLPYIQGPSDMVLNDLIRQGYAPGGAMDPYRDYKGPRDSQTGDILA